MLACSCCCSSALLVAANKWVGADACSHQRLPHTASPLPPAAARRYKQRISAFKSLRLFGNRFRGKPSQWWHPDAAGNAGHGKVRAIWAWGSSLDILVGTAFSSHHQVSSVHQSHNRGPNPPPRSLHCLFATQCDFTKCLQGRTGRVVISSGDGAAILCDEVALTPEPAGAFHRSASTGPSYSWVATFYT